MRKLLILILLTVSCVAFADSGIYRWQDSQGNIHYSDKPRDGASKVKLKPTQTYTPAPVPETVTKPTLKKGATKNDYSSLAITEPRQNQPFFGDSQGNVTVNINVPALAADHSLVLMMDGQPQSEPTRIDTTFHLTNVFRGRHILVAEIRDKNDLVIHRSPKVAFQIQLPFIRRVPLTKVKPVAGK